jgi:hypothetical protein
MRHLFRILCFIAPVALCGQVKVKDGAQHFYNHLVWTGNSKLMTQEQLLAAPVEKIPAGFLDTLKKYNWYDLCSYYFVDKKLSSPFIGLDTTKADPLSRQFNYFYVTQSGVTYRNYLLKTTKNEFGFYTNTFDTATATHVKSVSDIKGSTYLVQENYGELEYLKIVSYKNGVMIMELTRFGKPGEKPVMFRSAYLAMPKE